VAPWKHPLNPASICRVAKYVSAREHGHADRLADEADPALCGSFECITAELQDPSYPAYVDSSIIIGQTGEYREDIQGFDGIEYMRCGPDNSFFPDLSQVCLRNV